MKAAGWAGVAATGIVAAALAAEPPAVERVQGIYEGTWKDGGGAHNAEARCVAMGGHTYKLLVRRTVDGQVQRIDINGAADPDTGAVKFAGRSGDVESKAEYSDGVLKGAVGEGGALDLKRVKRTPPTLGKKPPEGAVVLFDGKTFDNMKARGGKWNPVDESDGSMQVPKGGMDSVPKFAGSYDAHVEFLCPLEPKNRGQGRGNSGCYQPCGMEIQVLDSFGTGTYAGGGCGGLYGAKKDPDVMEPIPSLAGGKDSTFTLASLPPLEWQTYDVEYRVKAGGAAAGPAKGSLTVFHNGIKIHDGVEVGHRAGGFFFQDHNNPVRYRNTWVLERKE